MNSPELTPWIKAKASSSNGNCVQMRRNGTSIQVRDSKNPDGPALDFTPDEFTAWLAGAKGGEFDQLA